MGALRRLYQGESDYDFPRLWRWLLGISTVVLLGSIASLATQGLALSIDFRGGSVWEVPGDGLSVEGARDVLAEVGKEAGAKIQEVTDADGNRGLRVQAEASKDVDESREIAAQLAAAAEVDADDVTINSIGPSWGSKITRDALRALVVFLVLIALYISWQLEWRMAVAAILALIHDMVVTVGFYSIFQLEVTPATVVSFLTILGFSLYDTIVVFDRVLENAQRLDRTGQYTYSAIMRRSLNQVLTRSLNTTIVALLPVVSILVIGGIVFDQTVMNDFAVALLVGLFSGVFSSLAIAPPVLVRFKEQEPRYRKVRQRAVDRGTLAEAEWVPPERMGSVARPGAPIARPAAAPGAVASTGTAAATAVAEAKAAQYQRAHPPRPRKQGKKR